MEAPHSKNLGKKSDTQKELRAAVHRALVTMEERYDKTLTTSELAKIAGLSTYHFHRAFRAVVGETVAKYNLRIRVERAASMLKSSSWQISEIGLACGFDTPASFARAFKRLYGKSPGEFREEMGTVPFLRGYLRSQRSRILPSPEFAAPTVSIEDWPSMDLLTLRYVGPVEGVLKPWSEILSWAKSNLARFEKARFFGLWFDDWSELDQSRYRYECAILPAEPVADLPKPFARRSIAPGQVATTFVQGSINDVEKAWKTLGFGWLPYSGFQPREEFALDEYPVELIDSVLPAKLVKSLLGKLSVRLCMPVQSEPMSF